MSKELTTIENETSSLVLDAESLSITNPKEMTYAVEFLSRLNKAADRIEAEKAKVMRPLLDAVNAERARWKPFESKLTPAIASVRKLISQYQTEQKRIADKKAEDIAARVGEGKGKLKPETAVKQMDAINTPEASVTTDAGMVKFRTVQKFEVTNLLAMPESCLLPNEVEIRKRMLKGEQVPGVRYFTEEMPINSR